MALKGGESYGQIGISMKYKMFVSTWNVGGEPPTSDLNFEGWLDVNNSSDIYILGFQEVVPLNARNVLCPQNSKISGRWNSLIGVTLNKTRSKHKKVEESDYTGSIGKEFRCIISKQMVGIFLTVWVRADVLKYISYPSVSCVGRGIMGCLGNKGAVSARFYLHQTSFCFVCCHLASGGKEGDEMIRNSNAMGILSRSHFSGGYSLCAPIKILDHDRIVLLGDLNYKISLPAIKTLSLVKANQWSKLLKKDQLRHEFTEGRTFSGWNEGVITFPPTYKYKPNSDEYHGFSSCKKGEKRRVPAWCDRIIWFGEGLKQKTYERCELKLSDHRPVRAEFSAEVEVSNLLYSHILFKN